MNTEDFVITPIKLTHGAFCPRCKVCKPLAKFTRRWTRAQAQAMGKVGNVVLITETTLCTECNPRARPKPPSKLSKRELRNRAAGGDMRAPIVEDMIEKRDVLTSRKRADTQHKRWAAEDARIWAPTQKALRNALQRSAALRANTRSPALIELLDANIEALRTVRDAATARKAQKAEPLHHLGDYLPASTRAALDAMLRALSVVELGRAHKPFELLDTRAPSLYLKRERTVQRPAEPRPPAEGTVIDAQIAGQLAAATRRAQVVLPSERKKKESA